MATDDGELSEKLRQELADISGSEQYEQAMANLSGMIAQLFKSLIQHGVDPEVAVRFTQTYIDATVRNMMAK